MPDRYLRQALFTPLGRDGQERLSRATVSIVGLGALGSLAANHLARAGVGTLRLYDRDFVELDNLQRQVLYTEADVRADLPKVHAAATRLREINSEIRIVPHAIDIHPGTVRAVFEGADLVVDGTDNFETRMVLNDAAIEAGRPWVYAGCVGSVGMVMFVQPGRTACFRCLVPAIPAPGSAPTCDTAGVLNAAVGVIASVESAEAIKWLAGRASDLMEGLFHADVWSSQYQVFRVSRLPDCEACGRNDLSYLRRPITGQTAALCGRHAVQVSPPGAGALDLAALEMRLKPSGAVRRNEFLLKFPVDELTLTVFADGRAIVQGTDDLARARSVYARFIGT